MVLKNNLSQYRELGGVIGTAISALFLFSIALMNLVVLIAIFRAWRRLKDGGVYADDDFNLLLAGRGFIARILRPMFRLISESWHMFPLGLLFGLGFDTATEVGLLGLSATQVSHGMSPWAIMVFPALFSAGMSLLDTLDGHLMLGAYGWSYMKPVRKIYYNMTITLVSVVVAIVVGGIEALGLFAEQFKLEGRIWNAIGALNENFGTLGYAIIGIFMFSWVLSMLIYRVKRFDEFVVVSTAGG